MKQKISAKERVIRAVRHKTADRLPLDLGSHINSSIHIEAYSKLTKYMRLDNDIEDPRIVNTMMRDVAVDPLVLDALDIDTRGIFYGLPEWDSRATRREEDESGGRVKPRSRTDEWGVQWRMPENGHYYDLQKAPLAGELTVQDIRDYPWPDPEDPGITKTLQAQIDYWKKKTDCALVCNLPSMFVHQSQYMRGFEDWFMDLAAEPTLSEALFDAVMDVKMGYATQILKVVGDQVDIIMTADDLGTQRGLQVSPRTYRKYFKPRQARFIENIRRFTDAPVLFHSCGSVFDIIDDLADIGVDILNPIQIRAANMEPELLKERFGHKIAFWGGMDIQEILPFGTVKQVEEEVKRLFDVLGPDGGWVLSASHNIQPEVPPENIVAMYKAGGRQYHK